MVIKKPCAVPATAGDFNDHPLNTDCGSELHRTFFLDWHKEELTVSKRTFPAELIPSHHTIRQDCQQYYNHIRFWTATAFLKHHSKSAVNSTPPATSFLPVLELINPMGRYFQSGVTSIFKDDIMTRLSVKQEVLGTRAGYIIRFTCPSCHTENAIINKTPKDFYRKLRDARCHHCRKCSTVKTHGANQKPGYSSA